MAYHLAQLNIARFLKPADDPVNADFVNAIDSVNAIAESQPGFVWRLVGDSDAPGAMDVQAFDDPQIIVNMSVWTDMASLGAFVYRNEGHRSIMRRRREWFDQIEFHMVLWWVAAGHHPTVEEAKTRLELLSAKGPTADAFTFKSPFPKPGDDQVAPVLDECA